LCLTQRTGGKASTTLAGIDFSSGRGKTEISPEVARSAWSSPDGSKDET